MDFLWDTFKNPDAMPHKIWVGHDAETNPPETVLFEGTPQELFSTYDTSIFANYQMKRHRVMSRYGNIVNRDTLKYRIDKSFLGVTKIKYE